MLPPMYKRGLSTPKRLRRREPNEHQHRSKLRRGNQQYQYENYLQYGHNKATCKNPSVQVNFNKHILHFLSDNFN